MGVNAQTTVPTFTASQVLTADQMNQSARTGVPVFAGTTERDAAFGGSGEKTLAEGQLCYLESTNVVQYYDGAAWATVGPSTPGGLVLISNTVIGSAVSSVTVSNCFSSTYDNYCILMSGGASTTAQWGSLTFGATTTGYYYFQVYGDTTGTTVNGNNGNNVASFVNAFGLSTNGYMGRVDVFNPNLAKYTYVNYQNTRGDNVNVGAAGWVANTTQYTGFTITFTNATGGNVRVYGYANS
jgi:hypothetical protein